MDQKILDGQNVDRIGEENLKEDMLRTSLAAASSNAYINLSAQKQLIRGFGGMNHVAWIGA